VSEYCTNDSLLCGFFTPSMISPSLFYFHSPVTHQSFKVNFYTTHTSHTHTHTHMPNCCIWNHSFRINDVKIDQSYESSHAQTTHWTFTDHLIYVKWKK